MSSSGMRRDWSPHSPVSDRVWAQAVLAVVERRLTLRQAAQTFGLQQAALHRLVRQHTLQQLRRPTSTTRSLPGTSTSPSNSDDSHFTAPASSSNAGNDRYVFPRLNPLALGLVSPASSNSSSNPRLPGVAATVLTPPPPVCELTPELNDEIVAVLREQFLQQQQYDDYKTTDGRYNRLEGYADVDIADVVRAIVGRNGRRTLPPNFPSVGWLAMFKRENDFIDVDDMIRARSRATSVNNGSSMKNSVPPQQLQQERYTRSYEHEQRQYELDVQQHRGDQLRWLPNRNFRQIAAPPPSSPMQHSPIQRRASYSWEDVDGSDVANRPVQQQKQQQQRLRCYPAQPETRDVNNFRRSPSAASSNSHPGHSDSGNASDRNYRQSNLVPAKVWEAAMEDVAIHGMSLRNAAKAHGVHFAALHRRLKKRQQHKLNMPCEPNYIPFEDEAGVVRVIHARAEMGVLLTFTELVDLLKRTALKHRSELPENVATALVRRFQSRVEQSVRHLIIDWPSVSNNVLYRLRDTSSSNGEGTGATGAPTADNGVTSSLPSVVSRSSGSLSSSGSSSSLSPHPQTASVFSGVRKSPVGTAPTSPWGKSSTTTRSMTRSNNRNRSSDAENSNSADSSSAPAATVSPDDNETASAQPCMILRL